MHANRLLKALALLSALALVGGCGSNEPKPNQVMLMPAPAIYEEGKIDPFTDNDPVSRGVQPGILYATDRAVATATGGHCLQQNLVCVLEAS